MINYWPIVNKYYKFAVKVVLYLDSCEKCGYRVIHTRVNQMQVLPMQDKQKVTLYIPPELHRQLKIKAAVDSESMSIIAEKAIAFYMKHSGVVEEVESSKGRSHRVYTCPVCSSSAIIRDGEMVALNNQPTILADNEELPVDQVEKINANPDHQPEEQLVPC